MVRTWCRGQWCLQEALRGGRWWAAAEDYLRALCDWLLCCHGNRRLLPPATPLLPVSTINLWNKDLGINSTMNQSSFWISKTDKEYAQSQTEKKNIRNTESSDWAEHVISYRTGTRMLHSSQKKTQTGGNQVHIWWTNSNEVAKIMISRII